MPQPLREQSSAMPLETTRLAAFATLGVATGGFNIPLQIFLPAYYTACVGLGLRTVGLVFLVARLWSAICDPLVGWASDRTRTRYGRRKPWILCGGALFTIGSLAVFLPPATAGAAWLGVSLLVLCLGWTATATPLYAWGGELSANPRERARIQAYIQTAASIGIFVVLLLPALFEWLRVGGPKLRIQSMGLVVVLALVSGLTLIGVLFREPPAAPVVRAQSGWLVRLKLLGSDWLLWRIIASDFFVALGQGARGAVFVFFVTQYLHLGIASLLLLLQYAFGIVASPLWARISYRLGRVRTLITAELTQVAINLLVLLVTPQRLWLLVGLIVAQGLAQGSGNLMLRALIYDVADRHRKIAGVERAGLFSSIFNVTTNAAMAISVAVAFFVIAQFGFQPKGPNSSHALLGLVRFIAIGPALGHLISALLIFRLPIDDRSPNLRSGTPSDESTISAL
jgi:GPH family glycoside/pentoside/hexuronide:cation symporter